MFGQDDTDKPQGPTGGADALTAALPDPIDTSAAAKPADDSSLTTPTLPTTINPTPTDDSPGSGAPSLPVNEPEEEKPEPESSEAEPDSTETESVPEPSRVSLTSSSTSSADDDLQDIKQKALEQLSPLVGHLDQTPEEKFRTTMMMIQASDNKDLVKDAFSAAQAISDDKTRAQALLDVINEINYFTQQSEHPAE